MIQSPNNRPEEYDRVLLEKLVRQGPTITEIGIAIGRTRQGARHIMVIEGLYAIWLLNREKSKHTLKNEVSQRNDLLGNLVSVLETRLDQLISETPLPVQKALENMRKPRTTISYSSLVKLFERYEQAKKSGVRLSLEQLGEGLGLEEGIGLTPRVVGRILSEAGEKPMYRSLTINRTSKEVLDVIDRAAYVDMRNTDISYFLGVPTHVVTVNIKNKRTISVTRSHLYRSGFKVLTYHKASQIYQWYDGGEKTSEIAELVDGIDEKIVNHAIEYRQKYEPRIIDALKILFPDEKIDRPYRVINSSHTK